MSKCDTCGGCSHTKEPATMDYTSVVRVLVGALETIEVLPKYHSKRVGELSKWLANYLGVDPVLCEMIEVAGNLHDIGMISLPREVLMKVEALSHEEQEQLQRHPVLGYELIHQHKNLDEVAQMVLEHHEWFDGTGYPSQYEGNEIHLGARIIGLCEAIDHMGSDRPYQEAMSIEQIEEKVREEAGTHFDPWLIMHLKELLTIWKEMVNASL